MSGDRETARVRVYFADTRASNGIGRRALAPGPSGVRARPASGRRLGSREQIGVAIPSRFG